MMLQPTIGRAQQPHQDDFKAQFLHLCDLACTELDRKDYSPFLEAERYVARPKTHHVPFFEDSHAVRALAVAYDMTGKREYLDTCRRWSDRMIAYQDKMIPKGAYYLNYYRQPGDTKDQWFSSDAASVGMAVLATAVRCAEKLQRERYLDSVRAFAKLVADEYVKDGGITDGLWTFDGPWWASTAICGEMFLLLYEETGDEQYRKIGVAAAHWLLKTDFRDSKPITMKERPSGIVFYDFGFYAVALKYLPADSPQRKSLLAQISEMLKWLEANQIGRGGKPAWAYDDDGHTDMAGLPFLMYSFAGQLPEQRGLSAEADRELRYIAVLILSKGKPPLAQVKVWEWVSWGMMSYAEKLSPGSLFRSSRKETLLNDAPFTPSLSGHHPSSLAKW
jgi:hypothetical protein